MANPVKVIKGAAKAITTGKKKAVAREKKYGTPSHKVAKQSDSFVNQMAKSRKKGGSKESPSMIAPRSVSLGLKTPKVPVKKRGK